MEDYTAVRYGENGRLPAGVIYDKRPPVEAYLKDPGKEIQQAADDAGPESTPEEPDEPLPSPEEMGRLVVPSAIWTAGVLYYIYYIGEEMRQFDVADILAARWAQGKLEVVDERTKTALDRLIKKRDRRMAREEREMLYKRVFNFGEARPNPYIPINETFPSDWNRLMKGVAAYPVHPSEEDAHMVDAARTMIFRATYDLQLHLSEAMAGTAYMMAAEVFTLLRESSDLLRGEEIIENFGVPGQGMNSVIEHIAAEEFNQLLPVELLSMLAEAGSRILQEWVAKFNPQTYAEAPGSALDQSFLNALIVPAQEWRYANTHLSSYF